MRNRATWILGLLTIVCISQAWRALGAAPATQPGEFGPDVVVLKELMSLYQPVPFDHRSHARMVQMWGGCTTCHHRSPQPTTRPAAALNGHVTQDEAATVPACKSCHPVVGDDANIRMPHLKGAYHRQCLNCHREWAQANDCSVCHKPRDGQPTVVQPTPDDIVARMHPPMPEPDVKAYRARFTPADGKNVLFRHKEHTTQYGLKCVSCHYRENCSGCHQGGANHSGPKPMKPGKTWADSHMPCITCHKQDRCKHCHYKDGQEAPPAFDHRSTGQILDKDHQSLVCGACHTELKSKVNLTCGDASCHKKGGVIAYPARRPGPVVTTRPAATGTETAQSGTMSERGTP